MEGLGSQESGIPPAFGKARLISVWLRDRFMGAWKTFFVAPSLSHPRVREWSYERVQ